MGLVLTRFESRVGVALRLLECSGDAWVLSLLKEALSLQKLLVRCVDRSFVSLQNSLFIPLGFAVPLLIQDYKFLSLKIYYYRQTTLND